MLTDTSNLIQAIGKGMATLQALHCNGKNDDNETKDISCVVLKKNASYVLQYYSYIKKSHNKVKAAVSCTSFILKQTGKKKPSISAKIGFLWMFN